MQEIVIDRLTKSYQKKVALQPLNITVAYGKTIILCGTNGAGKSTLLKIISGVHKQTSGTISGLKPLQIGYMPDSLQFPEAISGWQWLKFLGDLKGIHRKRLQEVFELVGLEKVVKDDVGTYSRGMQQRLLFAQMILSDPELLVMDEPENCLDPHWVFEWKNWIKSYKEQGKTIIFSSHIITDIPGSVDEILFFHNGKVVLAQKMPEWQKNKSKEEYFMEITRNGSL